MATPAPAVAQEKMATHAPAEAKPNILLMGDDIGWMQPGIYHRGLMVGYRSLARAWSDSSLSIRWAELDGRYRRDDRGYGHHHGCLCPDREKTIGKKTQGSSGSKVQSNGTSDRGTKKLSAKEFGTGPCCEAPDSRESEGTAIASSSFYKAR